MNNLCFIENIIDAIFLINKFNNCNWYFISHTNFFPELVIKLKLLGLNYISGKSERNIHILNFTKNKSKIKFFINISYISSVIDKIENIDKLVIYKTIPHKEIRTLINNNTKIVALSNTDYLSACYLKGNIIYDILYDKNENKYKYEYFDTEKEKIYEMFSLKMLCKSYIYI